MVNLLISNDADVEHPRQDGTTPLICASTVGSLPLVQTLIDAGADTNKIRPRDGVSPLIVAADGGFEDIVNALIASHATIDLAAVDGSTPLLVAAFKGHASIVRVLIGKNADVNKMQ